MSDVVAFIPCRAGSERVKNKNTREFAGYAGGLLEVKLQQLHKVPSFSKIVVSSNDDLVLSYAENFRKTVDSRVEARERPDAYGASSTSMEAFIRDYIAESERTGIMLMTHVTHPLVTSGYYEQAIKAYYNAIEQEYDSLVSVTELHRFLWRDGKPFNYDNSIEKWPRSQDIKVVHELNHAIYIIPFETMRSVGDRIGVKPLMYPMPEQVVMDIDWEDQFLFIEELVQLRASRGISIT